MPTTQRIVQHAPVVEVTAYSQYGRGPYLLTDPRALAFRSFSTHKDLNSVAGQFQLQLTSVRDHQGQTYRDILHAMDYIEIRAADLATNASPLPVVMRGFIDSVQESLQFDQAGNPTRTITITGSDWGKLLNIWQVQYLWPLDPYTAYIQAIAPVPIALSSAFNIPYTVQTASQFFGYILRQIVDPVAALYQGVIPQMPTPTLYTAMPSFAQIAPTYVEAFTGSYWNLLTYYQSPPFGECFLLDRDADVALIARLAPYHNYFGNPVDLLNSVKGDAGALEAPVVITIDDVASYQLGRTDANVYTYFLTQPDNSLPQALGVASFVSAPGEAAVVATDQAQGASAIAGRIAGPVSHPYLNPLLEPKAPANPIYVTDMLPIYGFRPQVVTSPWLGALLLNGVQQARSDAAQLTWWLYQTGRDNADWLAGTITLHGREDLRIGRYLVVDHGSYQMEFYIVSCDHTFVYTQPSDARGTWTTTLGVSRGRKLS